ncbi:MAG TPA: hypothetical protein VGK36_20360 [Candidatus Angelobacter sp.]
MSPAAQVRRDFRLGRPPRAVDNPEPLHPAVVWRRAQEALADFRGRMSAASLNPRHAAAVIVFIEKADSEKPCFTFLEEKGKTSEEMQKAVFETLSRADVIALGMIFVQLDEQTQQKAIFPYLFFGLNERGMAVLKRAAELEYVVGESLNNVN